MTSVAPERAVGGAVDVSDATEAPGRTPRELFWSRFKQDRLALIGVGFIVTLIIVAICAPLIAKIVGHGPNELFQREMTDEFGIPKGPNEDFIMGADTAGRDAFVRVIYGARTSLIVALVATGIATLIGVTLGTLAGFFGGVTDTVVSRTIDVILALPLLLLAIGISTVCSATKEGCMGGTVKPGLGLVIFIIALFSWPYIARIVRGQTLSIREKEFIEAGRSLGASNVRLMFREILPNLAAPILVYATLVIPNNILFEAALSFLGLGVPQRIPSWGRMLSDGAQVFEVAWWLMVFPGFFLLFTTLAFNLVGDGLRDALDPRTRR